MKKRKNWDLTLVIQSETSNRLNKSDHFLASHSKKEYQSGKDPEGPLRSLHSFQTTMPNPVKCNCLFQLIQWPKLQS